MKLASSPLLRFFLIGALLLLVYALATDWLGGSSGKRVEVGEADVALLVENFERTWRRPPTGDELRGLIDARVREEILYREALALGLDRDDVIVRRRMVQKMELLTQDMALMSDPTDEELRRFFEDNRETYRVPDRISFHQVFFSADRRGEAAPSDAAALLARIESGEVAADEQDGLGDPSLLAPEFRMVTRADIARSFGEDFAARLVALDAGWHGPLRSPFGFHLVNVTGRAEGGDPGFERVRAEVVRDLNRERRERALEQLYEGLLADYEVAIDEDAVQQASLEAARAEGR